MKSITQVIQNLLKPYIDNHRHTAEANIAPVETDATSASQNYSIGQQLILNDVLYDVTASITAGNPLSIGTNISAASKISSLLKNISGEIDIISAMASNSADEYSDLSTYAVGSYCIHDNKLYRCIIAVTSPASWAINSSCFTEDTIANALNLVGKAVNTQKLTTPSLASGVTNVNYQLAKKDDIIALQTILQKTLVLNEYNLLCTLPAGFRPPSMISFIGVNSTKGTPIQVRALASGGVEVYPTAESADAVPSNIGISIVYML